MLTWLHVPKLLSAQLPARWNSKGAFWYPVSMDSFLFCEMWICFLCPWKRIICYHKNEELSTPFPDTVSGCRTESLSTLTSCQRSKTLPQVSPLGFHSPQGLLGTVSIFQKGLSPLGVDTDGHIKENKWTWWNNCKQNHRLRSHDPSRTAAQVSTSKSLIRKPRSIPKAC